MKIYIISLISGIFILSAVAYGQINTNGSAVPFKNGEKLRFTISYKVGLVNTDVADVEFNTTYGKLGDSYAYKIHAFSTTYPFYKNFFDINDHYTTILDATTLKPIKLEAELQEGKYRFSSQYDYNWSNMTVNTKYRNHKHAEFTTKTMSLTDNSFDGVSFFYNLRCQNINNLKPGDKFTVDLVLEDTIKTISYRFVGKEVKSIKDYGRFNTLKFVCKLATSQGETFDDGSELYMWISDDLNKIPIYLETPIRVGKIYARLTNFSGLKFPLDSKLK